jgi:hypothetical protein
MITSNTIIIYVIIYVIIFALISPIVIVENMTHPEYYKICERQNTFKWKDRCYLSLILGCLVHCPDTRKIVDILCHPCKEGYETLNPGNMMFARQDGYEFIPRSVMSAKRCEWSKRFSSLDNTAMFSWLINRSEFCKTMISSRPTWLSVLWRPL